MREPRRYTMTAAGSKRYRAQAANVLSAMRRIEPDSGPGRVYGNTRSAAASGRNTKTTSWATFLLGLRDFVENGEGRLFLYIDPDSHRLSAAIRQVRTASA